MGGAASSATAAPPAGDFREQQRFHQPWLWLLVLGSLAAPVGGALYGFYRQIVLGQAFGDRPMSDGALIATTIGTLVFAGALIVLLRACVLTTRVDVHGVHVRFAPVHRRERHFPFAQIVSAEAIAYRPIRDYGGWGLRFGPRGKAYNVSGNRGVLLSFEGNKTLLIGSLRADALARAIRAWQRERGRG